MISNTVMIYRNTLALTLVSCLALGGCQAKEESTNTAKVPAVVPAAAAPAQVEPAAEEEPPDVPTPEDFEEEALDTITPEHLEQSMDDVEKELEE